MKNFYALVCIALVAFLASCGGDDGPSADPFAGIPSGEIVAVEQRDAVLTGTDSNGRQSYRWWAQNVSRLDFNTEECGDDEDLSQNNVYYAFTSDGSIRVRIGTEGDGSVARSWAWSSSSKDAINVDGETSVDFVIRSLNDSEVIYASVQSAGGCQLVTWERFTR